MNEAASDVYEIVLEETGTRNTWFRSLIALVTELLTFGDSPANPGGVIISVVHKDTGHELFRHVEDLGDDEGHMLHNIQTDLAKMSVDEFAAAWS